MFRSPAALAAALAVAATSAFSAAAPAHPAATRLLSCAVSSQEAFTPGVQMVSIAQTASGTLGAPDMAAGPACATTSDGITGLAATFTGTGTATCLTDPALRTVDLNGTVTITWKKAGGATVGSSQLTWRASQVELGSVRLAGRVSSGLFKGATMSVSGLSADAVTVVSGGCASGSPVTSIRTTDTYLQLTQA